MIIKYSVGGPITSIQDNEGVESIEEIKATSKTRPIKIVSCKKCGLQYAMSDGIELTCCGNVMRLN